jgi:hypothetical protein
MLQAAGGPESLDAATVLAILANTAPARDLSPLVTQALGGGLTGFVFVTALGEVFQGPNYFTISYIGLDGNFLDTLTIDGTKAGLIFDTSSSASPSLTIGNTVGINPADVSFQATGSPGQPKLIIKFRPGTFKPGASLSFTLDQDLAKTGLFGGSSDSLKAGATFTANVAGSQRDVITGTFASPNGLGTGYNQDDGFGVVDALDAVEAVLQTPSKSAPAPLTENPVSSTPMAPDRTLQ